MGNGYKWEMEAAVAQWIALTANGQEGHPTTVCFVLLAKIKVLCELPAHLPLVLDAGTALGSVPPSGCAGFVYCHCTGRWAVLDNTHGKHSWAFR